MQWFDSVLGVVQAIRGRTPATKLDHRVVDSIMNRSVTGNRLHVRDIIYPVEVR